ncbi:uncharacterized protein BYT42DRAFT_11711 [Radiomyces spectabilis]|uniref:uncharacterized protein n=1 Tax=Radiomyces spectabilis TaxID=64574 RepID=UPI00221ED6B2|nr:uncharacterized protein BYT42DRAFT_11711 [Radiomyces spectabilis]KAI8393565.1 hypothetical protein BYT42DRAFT_11711 [Radiomyces spectabilis]
MSRSNSITSTSPIHDNLQYDPEIYFQQASIAEARALEKRTRNNIAMQQKKLRAMVGEQYVDLISAADTIIAMSKTAQQVQKTVDHMQSICEVGRIRKHAIQTREAATQASGGTTIYFSLTLLKVLWVWYHDVVRVSTCMIRGRGSGC